MKTLVIAEKPKVANEILKLPRFRGSIRKQGSKPYYGYYENERYIVTWCRGHLLEVMNPEEHDPKYKQFRFEDLPIFLPIKYKPVENSKEQLTFVVDLMKREDVNHIVNASDNDREGELIFREIYEYASIDKKVSRIFKSSHEAEELEEAFNNLLPGSQFDSLATAAKGRQYLDHLLGDTITRASTTKLANNQLLLSSGRIQMCLLAEVRKRELEVENFLESTFFNLAIKTENGINALLKTEQQFLTYAPLKLKGESLKGNTVTVKSYEEKDSKSHPKNLYNLTDIYKEADKKFKANTTIVQKHIQDLYDSGYITYPRSDSRHLPVSRLEKVQDSFNKLSLNERYSGLTKLIDPAVINEKHSAFNDEKVTAHYAILPTNKKYEHDGKPELEQKLYDLIVRRFLGKFMPSAIYKVRKISLIDSEGEEYFVSERLLKEPGYLTVFKEDIEENTKQTFSLPEVLEGQSLIIESYEIIEGKTRKPSLHNVPSILTFMENAGRYIEDEDTSRLLKGKRIGTTATEHSFIPKLIERKFIDSNEKGYLLTTGIGRNFVDVFPVNELKNPDFTAELEGGIEAIKEGTKTFESFTEQTQELAKTIVREMSQVPNNIASELLKVHNEQITICTCLCKEGTIVDKGAFYGCTCYPKCKVTFGKKIREKTIPIAQIRKIFDNGTTDLIKGFKKDDNSFDAFLFFDNGQLKFRFPTAEDKSLGLCPKCTDGHVLLVKTQAGTSFYGCSNYKSGCTFQFPHTLLNVTLSVGQVRKYIKDGHTDFINGFTNKEGKVFTAALQKNENHEMEFKMPTKEDRTLGKCLACNSDVLVGKQYYLCEKYKNGCDFIIPGEYLSKSISSVHVKKLLKNNMTELIKGFKKKDGSGTFDAKLTYDIGEKRLKFVFAKKTKNQ